MEGAWREEGQKWVSGRIRWYEWRDGVGEGHKGASGGVEEV